MDYDLNVPYLWINWVGGNCPVQAEGLIAKCEFFFRARGDSWSFTVTRRDGTKWVHTENYGKWPDAGWMSENIAKHCIAKAAELFLDEEGIDEFDH